MMQKLLAAAGICLMALAGPAAASTQTVITFDDVNWGTDPNGASYKTAPSGYGGVETWSGGDLWGNHYYGIMISMEFAAPVSFVGADAAFYGGGNPDYWRGYSLFYQGNEVFSEIYSSTNPEPERDMDTGLGWVSSGYSGAVDRIEFFGMHEGVSIDNVTYAAAPVPEPGSVAMVLAGLGLVGGLARRRQAKD